MRQVRETKRKFGLNLESEVNRGNERGILFCPRRDREINSKFKRAILPACEEKEIYSFNSENLNLILDDE